MNNEVNLKIQEYVAKLKECEEKEDFTEVLRIIQDYQTFLNGILVVEKNDLSIAFYLQIFSSLNILRRLIKLTQYVKEKERENNSEFNNLKARITRIEERFDKLEALK